MHGLTTSAAGDTRAEPCPHPDGNSSQAAELPPLSLSDVRRQFEREARREVFDTGRYRCPYYMWGQGPSLVFIPGLCDDALSFMLPIARLSRHFRCVAYDLPTGQGDGARLTRYRHADFVSDLFALADHVGAKKGYLYGASFGSTIALAALAEAPACWARGVLQGGFARRPLAPAEVLLSSWARWWPWPMRRLPLHRQLLRSAHAEPFVGRPPEFWDYFIERFESPPMRAVAQRAQVLNRTDLRPILPRVHQPILLICGDRDPLVGKECEQVLLAGLPNAGRAEFARCGHVPQFSHPELLAEVVARFLTPLRCE